MVPPLTVILSAPEFCTGRMVRPAQKYYAVLLLQFYRATSRKRGIYTMERREERLHDRK